MQDHLSEQYLESAKGKLAKRMFWPALDDLNRAIDISPSLSEAYFLRGWIKQYHDDEFVFADETDQKFKTPKDYDVAIDDFSKSIKLKPSYDAFYWRGVVKFKKEDFASTIIDCTKALKFSESNSEVYYLRAEAKVESMDFRGAILDYTRVINFCPEFLDLSQHQVKGFFRGGWSYLYQGYVYWKRGLAKLRIDQKEEGCLDFSRAGELGCTRAYKSIIEFCNK